MSNRSNLLALVVTWIFVSVPAVAVTPRVASNREESTNWILWRPHSRMQSLNLYYGPGGKTNAPKGTIFHFVKEDLSESNPKFTVRDDQGVKWKVKLGEEARPETVATRLLWAAGYTVDEDYFFPQIRVTGLPRLHRGRKFVAPGGIVHGARLERERSEEKVAEWKWSDNPFVGNQPLNGLRVMMALMNNWDLKPTNNSVLQDGRRRVFAVTDLGTAFGTTGYAWGDSKAKGNVREYERSEFITKVTPEYINFKTPSRPSLMRIFGLPAFVRRLRMQSIGDHVPRNDARWIGGVLGKLSRGQIADAFRAAHYSPAEVERFTAVVVHRINQLQTV